MDAVTLNFLQASSFLLLLLLAVSVWTDFREHRIPNWVVFSGFLVVIGSHTIAGGLMSGLQAAGSGLFGMALFAPLYMLEKMGAGDVKLLGVCGAYFGVVGVFWIAMYTLIAGAILAGLWLVRKIGPQALSFHVVALVTQPKLIGTPYRKGDQNQSAFDLKMPYAAAIAAGVLVYLRIG